MKRLLSRATPRAPFWNRPPPQKRRLPLRLRLLSPPVAEAVAAERAVRLQAAQDQAAQYLREERYPEAKRALKEAEQIQAEDAKTQWLAEAKAEREKALLLTNEGQLTEAKQALEQADELARKAAGRLARPKQFLAAIRSRSPQASKAGARTQRRAGTASGDRPGDGIVGDRETAFKDCGSRRVAAGRSFELRGRARRAGADGFSDRSQVRS